MKLPKVALGKRYDKDSYVVLDITSTSVKALSFSKGPDNKLIVNGVSVGDSYKDPLRKEMIENAVEECSAQSGIKVKEAIVGLGGSNVLGFILIAKIRRSEPDKKIAEKEIESIYNKVREAAYNQVKQRWSAHFADEANFEPLDLVVTSIYVDDSLVTEPIGTSGEYVKVSVFSSYAEKKYYQWIIKTVERLKFSSLTVTTTMYSQVKLLSEKEKNFILVDIGKDYTDVSVVLGKNIILSRSIEMGGSYFSQYLADKTGTDFASANGKKESYALQKLGGDEMGKIGDYLYEAGKNWRIAFSATLSSMSGIKSFPSAVYLSGGGANLDLVEELLYEEDWRRAIPFAKDIKVTVVLPDILNKYVKDGLGILSDMRMFVPASLGVIKLELDETDG